MHHAPSGSPSSSSSARAGFAFLESLAFADDDRYVAIVGCADGLSTVVAGRVSTRTRPTPIAQVPCPAAIRNDLIVAFDHDDEVKRWTLDAAPLAPLHPLAPSTREIVTAGGDPNDLAISPDGSTVLAGYADGVLRLWRLP